MLEPGGLMARDIADQVGLPAFIGDPAWTGSDDLARLAARDRAQGNPCTELEIAARRQSKIWDGLSDPTWSLSTSAADCDGHCHGRMVDVNQALMVGRCPGGPAAAGGRCGANVLRRAPVRRFEATYDEMFKKLAGKGGLSPIWAPTMPSKLNSGSAPVMSTPA